MEASRSVSETVVRHLECTCRTAIDGRRAARALAELAEHFSISEAEFQVLWCLRTAPEAGVDQTTIAAKLVISPAQVSAIVERVCARDWIHQRGAQRDRRRRLWRLSADGRNLIEQMLQAAVELRAAPEDQHPQDREVAA